MAWVRLVFGMISVILPIKCYFVTWWAIRSLHQSLTRNPLDPGGFVALHLFLGIRFKFLFPLALVRSRKKSTQT